MRILCTCLLLLLVAPGARGQEGADAATAQLPKGTPICVRVASLDRVDTVVKEWLPMLKMLGLGDEVAPLEQMPASSFLFTLSGLNEAAVDKTKPIYMGLADEEPVVVLHPAAGATWEGKKELREGAFAILRGGAIVAGQSLPLQVEPRGVPTSFLVDGDIVVHVYLADLIAQHREDIERMAAEAVMAMGAQADLPQETRALLLPVMTALKNGVMSLDSFDYAMRWTGDRLESEGFLAIKEGSGLRNLLKRAGEPGTTNLTQYLPRDAFLTFTSVMNPDWPLKEMKEMLEKAGGAGVAEAVLQLMSVGAGIQDKITGRYAGAMNIGMMMSQSMCGLYELKPGVDPKSVFEGFDLAKANEGLKKLGLPIGYTFEKAAAKDGDTEIHRFSFTSEDPMMAMQLAMMQGCMAVEGGFMFMAMSPTAEDDLRALLGKVRRGEKTVDHPHDAAMARLGRGHNLGFTLNLGALKPMAMMFGMMGMPPGVAQAFQNVPDVLPLSTAVTFPDGNIRWRGDWPVKEVVKIAEAFQKGMQPPPPPPGEPAPTDEFD
jgi:hypothetical protein